MGEHCNSTCQLHEGTQERITTLEQEVHGKEGLQVCFAKVVETLDTIKKAVYGLIALVFVSVGGALLKLVISP